MSDIQLNVGSGKECSSCGGTVADGRKTCQNCGHSFSTLEERVIALEASVLAIGTQEFGDVPGHEFHGNQYSGGSGRTPNFDQRAKDHPIRAFLFPRPLRDPIADKIARDEKVNEDFIKRGSPVVNNIILSEKRAAAADAAMKDEERKAHENAPKVGEEPKNAYESMGHPLWIGQLPMGTRVANLEDAVLALGDITLSEPSDALGD